ncbi:putative laglidadg DNA endonuclease, partial (mitochondrion) [Rhizoctonia solani 123E]
AINRIGPHNEDVIAVLIGLLLGDGYAANRSGEGVRFSIKQSITHKDYLFSLYEFFLTRGYCSKLEPRKYTRTIKGVDKEYYGYEFNTFTFRSFYWLYSSFYKNGKKIVPQILEKYMTALTLAIWIEMNGSWVQGKLVLNTCFSSKKDIEILVKVLQNSFGIKSYLKMSKKGKYRIEISSESINLIKRLECPKIF